MQGQGPLLPAVVTPTPLRIKRRNELCATVTAHCVSDGLNKEARRVCCHPHPQVQGCPWVQEQTAPCSLRWEGGTQVSK